MRKIIKILLLCLVFALFSTPTAHATFLDLDPNDLNSIMSFSFNGYSLLALESYGETFLTPYPPYGQAIVTPQLGFFDKLQQTGPDLQLMTLAIYNYTPYVWSDYHLEFYKFISGYPWIPLENLNDFLQSYLCYEGIGGFHLSSGLSSNRINFWNGSIFPGQLIYIDLFFNTMDLPEELIVRQVATTDGSTAVPLPAALWLLGGGLIGLVGIKRKLVG